MSETNTCKTNHSKKGDDEVSNEIRIGLIGCGNRSRVHIAGFEATSGARIAAVCDVDAERAEETGTRLGVPAYHDVAAMLEKESVDCACIVAPAFVRGEIEELCIDAGVPFLLEKPVAVELEIAARISERLRRSGLLACIGYQLRYGAEARAISRWSEGRRIGMAEGRYWCGFARQRPEVAENPRIGGQLIEQVTHTFDLMRYWMGEVDEVFSFQTRGLVERDGPANDSSAVALKFKRGAVASVSATWGSSPKHGEANVVTLFAGDERVEYRTGSARLTPGELLETREEPTLHQSFVEAVRTGDASGVLSSYDDALRTLLVSVAANESAKTGQPVRVDRLLQA